MANSKAAKEGFDAYHEDTLPKLLSGEWGQMAARGARSLPPLAIRLPDGRAYTYQPDASTVRIAKGDEGAATVVELDEVLWQGVRHSLETPSGLVLTQRVRVVEGEVGDFMRWEPALRVLYEEIPAYDPEAVLIGSDGGEVDPTTSFYPNDDPERMADFLRTTGYILVREVLPSDEIESLLEVAEALRAAAREEDGGSWWSQHEDGRRMCSRVINGGADPRIRALPGDPRLMRIVALSDYELEPTPTDNLHVLFKHSGMVFDGKADQPWHRDCGLGGHALMCPIMNGSVFLLPANRETGELRFMPGSWKTAGCSVVDDDDEIGIGIEANPGDFAIHYGDGMHAGTPPTASDGPFRI
ncbi:MAG: phytanoyl-CoA dioxygenase family protein, partial [Deltaproteobacteria bacterium]|nr:phytanoyl-CoA dioxygenase family protein [Deltaproteobacteria bacterium]